jgi:glutathione S-transferase
VRAYLRKQGIPFEERTAGHPAFRAEVLPQVGRWIIPVLQTSQGLLLQDGADIIDYFEQQGKTRFPAFPLTPKHRALSHIFELFGGEGLLRPAMHFRWNFDDANLAFLRDEFGASLAPPGSDQATRDATFDMASKAMRKASTSFGVTPDSVALVEANFFEFLDLFSTHLAHAPYLLGGAPTLGDYALFAPLFAHLGRDPYPASLIKQRAPRLGRWIERMNSAEQGAGEYANSSTDLFSDDSVPPSLQALLQFIAQDYLPEIEAHNAFTQAWLDAHSDLQTGTNGLPKPGARAIGMATFMWRGQQISSAVLPYRQYLLQRLQDFFDACKVTDQEEITQCLQQSNLQNLLHLRPTRRIQRDNFLEVWSAANS